MQRDEAGGGAPRVGAAGQRLLRAGQTCTSTSFFFAGCVSTPMAPLRAQGYGLFNMGNESSREWMVRHISKLISDAGIDHYRQDFNFVRLPRHSLLVRKVAARSQLKREPALHTGSTAVLAASRCSRPARDHRGSLRRRQIRLLGRAGDAAPEPDHRWVRGRRARDRHRGDAPRPGQLPSRRHVRERVSPARSAPAFLV